MPTVVSVLLFIFYYIVSLTGEKVVRESILTSFQGMWLSSFILLVIGIFLTYKATTDSAIFNVDVYLKFFTRILGIEKTTLLEKKIYLTGKFDYTEIERESLIELFEKLIRLSAITREDVKSGNKLKNLIKSYPELDTNKGENFGYLGILYNGIFEDSINSKWVKISYIKTKFAELPYVNFDISKNLIPGKVRMILAILFPIGIMVMTVNVLRTIAVTRKLGRIEQLSRSIINGLNNPTLLSELDTQL